MAVIARGQITIAFVDDGIGIASVDTYYYLSTSSTTLTGGSWSTTAPTWGNGKYMWMKTKITYTDSTYKESVAVCITGQQGSTGKGVSNIITEYYLSSSQSTQTGGSWSVTPPTNLTGRYLWTRTKVTYTDNTISYTTPICDSRLNDMEQQIETVIKKQASIDTTLADITLQASETIEKLYQYSAGYGNIFDNCAQVISKDSSLKTEISLSNMVPVSGLDYSKIQGKDICISVNISAKKAIPKTLNNYMGAYFTVTYSDNTIKKYMTAFWPGVRYLEQQLAVNTTSMFQRIYNVYTLENKAIKSISNLTLVISCNGEELKVSDPKVEVGSVPTGNDIETKQLIERMNKAELKISPEAITQAVSKQLAEGGELRTTKYVFDVDGAHYYDGGIDISNKAGEKVFVADTDGNLTLRGTIEYAQINSANIDIKENARIGNILFLGDTKESSDYRYISLNGGEVIPNSDVAGNVLYYKGGEVGLIGNKLCSIGAGPAVGGAGVEILGNGQIALSGWRGITSNVQITVTSDERKKKNIKNVDLSLLIDEIDICSFEYTTGGEKQVGVIAQRLLETEYVEYLIRIDNEGFYAVDYNTINMALVQKVQQQNKELKELRKKLDELEILIRKDIENG